MVGRVLSHYRILEQIGSGGMGEVYLAEDLRLHRRVALKVLSEDSRASVTRSARFEREMKAIAAINHPNVVTLYDVDDADGQRFLAMELVEGDTLAETLRPGEKLQLPRFLDIAIPLVDGLRAAHALGIAHRDLKPRNVMIDREGRVKLLDFGLAAWRQAGSAEADRDLTRSGMIVGTPAYLSPEQLCGEPVDPRSDLFQLGVLFYELLTGRRPFNGATPSELTSSILRDQPEPLRALRPELPERIGAIVQRCLEKRVGDRWRSAEELLAALRELELESQVQRITGQLYATTQRRRRRLVAIGWTAAVCAAVIGVGAGIWWRDRVAGPEVEPHVVPVVTWSGQQSDAQLSPDREWVSFLDSGFGPGQVYLQRVVDGQPQRLSEGASAAIAHLWAADGERVALLVESAAGRYVVQVFRPLTGTAERILPLTPGQGFTRLVRWFGERLYLEGDGGLYRLDLGNGALALLVSRDQASWQRTQFDVSADESRAVFGAGGAGRISVAHVVVLESGTERLLTLHDGNDFHPRWIGPRSDTVVVRSDRAGRGDLWLVPVDNPRRSRPVLFGSWEEEIDFASQVESVATFRASSRDTDLHLLDPRESPGVMPVTTGASSSGAAAVSRAGDVLVYQESDPRLARKLYPFGSRIVVARLQPGELIVERRDLGEGALPLLSPSGGRVAFLRKVDAGYELVVHELDTHYEQGLTESFAFPGIEVGTWEPRSANVLWRDDDELLFVTADADGGSRLRRWRAGSEPGTTSVVQERAAPGMLTDLVPFGDGERVLFLESPGSPDRLLAETGQHHFAVWSLGPEGAQPFARVAVEPSEVLVRLLGQRAGTAVVAVARLNTDWSFRVRVLETTAPATAELGAIDRSASISVALDRAGDRILFSAKDPRDGVYNLFEQALATGERRQLTFNRQPGILFSDLVVLPERRVLLSVTFGDAHLRLDLLLKTEDEAGEAVLDHCRQLALDGLGCSGTREQRRGEDRQHKQKEHSRGNLAEMPRPTRPITHAYHLHDQTAGSARSAPTLVPEH